MTNLYLTGDRTGTETGGGIVTQHELDFLRTMGETQVISRAEMEGIEKEHPHVKDNPEPWKWDNLAYFSFGDKIKLCHAYSGSFPDTIGKLKRIGAKIAYSVVAHDRDVSREEHEKVFGINFSQLYPHLCDPILWSKYIEGYRKADVIVCPSTASERSIRKYGGEFEYKRIEIIPHGVDIPDKITPLPKQWRLGYAGSYSADKGVIYLLQAWKKLNYSDGILILGGQDSNSPISHQIIEQIGCKNVICLGWIDHIPDFYNALSAYVQPSVTEGWGLEVSEAASFGRPVICSEGVGAADLVDPEDRFPIRDVDALAERIDRYKKDIDLQQRKGTMYRERARNYSWDIIKEKYVGLWKELLV